MRIIDLRSDNSVVKLILMHLNYQCEAYSFSLWLITVETNLCGFDWLLEELRRNYSSYFFLTLSPIQSNWKLVRQVIKWLTYLSLLGTGGLINQVEQMFIYSTSALGTFLAADKYYQKRESKRAVFSWFCLQYHQYAIVSEPAPCCRQSKNFYLDFEDYFSHFRQNWII